MPTGMLHCCTRQGGSDIFCQQEITSEEKKADRAVRRVPGVKLHEVWGRTLNHNLSNITPKYLDILC